MENAKITKPKQVSNTFHWFTGFLILLLNKVKHEIEGYKSPRGFPISEIEKGIRHDLTVVDRWKYYLQEYCKQEFSLDGKNVLELGPGADLGVGMYLLALGAESYYSLDVNNLVEKVPAPFYEALIKKFYELGIDENKIREVQEELNSWKEGAPQCLNYTVRKDFDISIFKDKKINLILSNAAFEHFDNPPEVIASVSKIVQPGAIFAGLVDLKTHTRWIRQRDPLNIYRYGKGLYHLLKFSGSPNRVRPYHYKEALENNGWTDVQIVAIDKLEAAYLTKIQSTLAKDFRSPKNQMDYLSIMVMARKVK